VLVFRERLARFIETDFDLHVELLERIEIGGPALPQIPEPRLVQINFIYKQKNKNIVTKVKQTQREFTFLQTTTEAHVPQYVS